MADKANNDKKEHELIRQFRQYLEKDLTQIFLEPETLLKVDELAAAQLHIIPLRVKDGTLELVTDLIDNSKRLVEIGQRLGCKISMWYTSEDNFRAGIRHYYGNPAKVLGLGASQQIGTASEDEEESEQDEAFYKQSNSPLVKKVDDILIGALPERATDIHIHPKASCSVVKYRIDGDLEEMRSHQIAKKEKTHIVNRIKIMCNPPLDIARRDIRQDGGFQIPYDGKKIDCRINILPTIWGEEVAIRLLDAYGQLRTLDSLGFSADEINALIKYVTRPSGLILVTGPTGSGKTTTEYAMLEILRATNTEDEGKLNILTIEDPPEYLVDDYAQVLVRKPEEFDENLIAIMRQDPDVILVGEIRSSVTAETAIRASLTGHRVFSTLHTRGAVSSIARMFNMGVDRQLLLGEMNVILSQRLFKTTCTYCAEPDIIDDKYKIYLSDKELDQIKSGTPMRGHGCKHCDNRGYSGRVAVGEFLFFDNEVRDFFSEPRKLQETQAFLQERNFKSMWDKGLALVCAGKVSLNNLVSVMRADT
jgi:Type II secretory pathway, ATPase PulE/Tfp pilus assembly pathway, ATPase PilB